MSTVQNSQVVKMAKLAQLALTETEVALFSQQLGQIVDFVDSLTTVDTAGCEPLFSPLYLMTDRDQLFEDSRREDSVAVFEGKVIAAAPQSQEGCYLILGDPGAKAK